MSLSRENRRIGESGDVIGWEMWGWLIRIIYWRTNRCTIENTSEYGYEGFTGYAKVISVYDGDTLRVAVKLPDMKSHKIITCRMDGYDSPEIRPSRTAVNRDEIIMKAHAAKEELAKFINRIVCIHILGFDKYGRFLVVLRESGKEESINDYMIRTGHGYEYHGGKKS